MAAAANGPESREDLEITLGKLKHLGQDERILLGLYFFESLTAEEISTVLEVDVKVVRARLSAVFTKLNGWEKPDAKSRDKETYLRVHG